MTDRIYKFNILLDAREALKQLAALTAKMKAERGG